MLCTRPAGAQTLSDISALRLASNSTSGGSAGRLEVQMSGQVRPSGKRCRQHRLLGALLPCALLGSPHACFASTACCPVYPNPYPHHYPSLATSGARCAGSRAGSMRAPPRWPAPSWASLERRASCLVLTIPMIPACPSASPAYIVTAARPAWGHASSARTARKTPPATMQGTWAWSAQVGSLLRGRRCCPHNYPLYFFAPPHMAASREGATLSWQAVERLQPECTMQQAAPATCNRSPLNTRVLTGQGRPAAPAAPPAAAPPTVVAAAALVLCCCCGEGGSHWL